MQPPFDELRSRWEAAIAQGRDLGATELFPDCHNFDELERAISHWRALRAAGGQLPPDTGDTLVGSRNPNQSVAQIEEPAGPPGYEIVRVLGRGGMGVVYLARQISLNREVALKMILGGYHAGKEEQQRFLIEAEAVAAIHHPGIVQVYEHGTLNGLPFLAMEYCSGGSLAELMHRRPPNPRESAELLIKLARAIHAAHARGIVHRDVKPANVLLDENGTPKITDFGLAKRVAHDSHLTRTGAMMGTPAYVAPEQAAGRPNVGPAADVWALGVILYEFLTGKLPFRGDSAIDTIKLVSSADPAPPRKLSSHVPRDLETICLKCLHKEPEHRYASAAEMADDLKRYLAGEVIQARRATPAERLLKWVRRQPVIAALVTLLAISTVSGLVATSMLMRKAQTERDAARQATNEAVLAKEKEEEARKELANHLVKSESRLAQSLLTPLGGKQGPLEEFELVALEQLASLERQHDAARLFFVEHALDAPASATRLNRRLPYALRAAVGLNEKVRRDLLDGVRPHLRAEEAHRRQVAARVVAGLGDGTGEEARQALVILTRAAAGSDNAQERADCLADLENASGSFDADTAAAVAAVIAEVLPAVGDANEAMKFARVFEGCARKMPAERARPLAAGLCDAMLDRVAKVKNEQEWGRLHAFAYVASVLDGRSADALIVRLLNATKQDTTPLAQEAVAEAFAGVAARAADKRSAAARELSGRAIAALPGQPVKEALMLAKAVSLVAPSLGADDAASVAGSLRTSMKTMESANERQGAAEMARALLPRLGETDAVALANELVALADQAGSQALLATVSSALCDGRDALPQARRAEFGSAMARELGKRLKASGPAQLEVLARQLAAVAERLGGAEAGEILTALAVRVAGMLPSRDLEIADFPLLALAMETSARRLSEKQALTLLEETKRQVVEESTAGELWVLAAGYGAVAERVEAEKAKPVREALLAAMKRVVDKEKKRQAKPLDRLGFQLRLALGLRAMGDGLHRETGPIAAALAEVTAAEVTQTSDQIVLLAVAEVLQTLRPLLKPQERERTGAPVAAAISRRARAANGADLCLLAKSYRDLMSHRDKAEAPDGAAVIGGRARELFLEAEGLKELLEAVEAYWQMREWLSEAPDVSWRASQVVVRETAFSSKRDVQERMHWLGVAIHDLKAEQLIELLQHPACVGPVERAVCARLSELSGRKLTGVWDVATWAREQGLGRLLDQPAQISAKLHLRERDRGR